MEEEFSTWVFIVDHRYLKDNKMKIKGIIACR